MTTSQSASGPKLRVALVAFGQTFYRDELSNSAWENLLVVVSRQQRVAGSPPLLLDPPANYLESVNRNPFFGESYQDTVRRVAAKKT